MSITSIVVQCLFLLLVGLAFGFQQWFRFQVMWASAKWTPLVPSQLLKNMLHSNEIIPQIGAMVLGGVIFYAVGWYILMVAYPTMLFLNHLIPILIALYWKRHHNQYATV